MMMNKRTFTKEEKLRIIKEASEQGVKIILEEYDLYPATYYSWKRQTGGDSLSTCNSIE